MAQPANRMIERSEYAVHLRAMWLGETIANWTGIRTEGRRSDAPFFTDADWGTFPFPDLPYMDIGFFFWGNPWNSDDDTDIEYVYLHLMSSLGVNRLTPEQIAAGWTAHMNWSIWVSNANARAMIGHGVRPPMTAVGQGLVEQVSPKVDQSLMIDAQLTTEFFGALCPGMPERALAMADLPIRTTATGHAVHASQMYVVMYALASQVDRTLTGREQAEWLVRQARKFIPSGSKAAEVVDFVLADFVANPDVNDWESTRDKVYERFQLQSTANGYLYRGWPESSVNFACGLIALLYGQMDFERTVQIGTLSGWDSDNGTATMGGLVALVQGQAFMATYGWCSDRYHNRTRSNMPDYLPLDADAEDTFTLMAQRMLPIVDREVESAGGRARVTPTGGVWLLPPGGAGDGLSSAAALAKSPTSVLNVTSANNIVRAAGGVVTAFSTVAGSPPGAMGTGDVAVIANGREHDFRGLEDFGAGHAFYSTERASAVSGEHVLSVEYDRAVQVKTVRFIAGDFAWNGSVNLGSMQSARVEVRVGGVWETADVASMTAIDANQPFQIIDCVLVSTVAATGVRVAATPNGSGGFVTCMELDAIGPGPSIGASFDVNHDGEVTVDDLYAWYAGPVDLNADGAASDVDARYLEAALRFGEAAEMTSGRR